MAADNESSSDRGAQDPYSYLGLQSGASFDDVQKARDERLAEVGDDPQARAKVEASYDAVLMNSLKQRQLGNVSSDALNASEREEVSQGGGGLLTRLRSIKPSQSEGQSISILPDLMLPDGQGLWIRVALGVLAILLVLVAPGGSVELILALSTIGLFISQIRRGRKPLASLGWSVVTLSIGLILGGLLVKGVSVQPSAAMPLSGEQIESLPALLLIWLGALLLA